MNNSAVQALSSTGFYRAIKVSNISRCIGKYIIMKTTSIYFCGCHGNQVTTEAIWVARNYFDKELSYVKSTRLFLGKLSYS